MRIKKDFEREWKKRPLGFTIAHTHAHDEIVLPVGIALFLFGICFCLQGTMD